MAEEKKADEEKTDDAQPEEKDAAKAKPVEKKADEKKTDDAHPEEKDAAKAKPVEKKAAGTSKTSMKAGDSKPTKPKAKKAKTTKKKAAETPADASPAEAPTAETPPVETPAAEGPIAKAAETPSVEAKSDEPKTLTDLADLGAATSAAAEAAKAAEASSAEAVPDEAPAGDPKTLTDLADLGPAAAPAEAPVYEQQIDPQGRAYATGKRKDAVARVWLKPGAGRVTVNDRDIEVFFARPVLRMLINQPFEAVGRNGQYDVLCTVRGGGLSGQAGAVRHGISKTLLNYEPALRTTLKAGGFLTRDARVVERKKYGKAKARRSFQFSKR